MSIIICIKKVISRRNLIIIFLEDYEIRKMIDLIIKKWIKINYE